MQESATKSRTVDPLQDGECTIRKRSTNRNKIVKCKLCFRCMRSDTLKRHMKTHQKLHALDEEEMRNEIKRRKKLYKTKEEREKLIKKIIDYLVA